MCVCVMQPPSCDPVTVTSVMLIARLGINGLVSRAVLLHFCAEEGKLLDPRGCRVIASFHANVKFNAPVTLQECSAWMDVCVCVCVAQCDRQMF